MQIVTKTVGQVFEADIRSRWEHHIENFLGSVHLACLRMLLRQIT
jgi:hypothetical protein